MVYELIIIIVTLSGHYSGSVGVYNSMEECFDERDKIVEEIGRPIINYQAICILEDKDSLSVGKVHGKYERTF